MTRTLPRSEPAGRSAAGLPRHRSIVALDIEQSTSRPDSVKAELRRALYHLFEQIESDLHVHVHLENNVLFPRALKLGAAAGVASCG